MINVKLDDIANRTDSTRIEQAAKELAMARVLLLSAVLGLVIAGLCGDQRHNPVVVGLQVISFFALPLSLMIYLKGFLIGLPISFRNFFWLALLAVLALLCIPLTALVNNKPVFVLGGLCFLGIGTLLGVGQTLSTIILGRARKAVENRL